MPNSGNLEMPSHLTTKFNCCWRIIYIITLVILIEGGVYLIHNPDVLGSNPIKNGLGPNWFQVFPDPEVTYSSSEMEETSSRNLVYLRFTTRLAFTWKSRVLHPMPLVFIFFSTSSLKDRWTYIIACRAYGPISQPCHVSLYKLFNITMIMNRN